MIRTLKKTVLAALKVLCVANYAVAAAILVFAGSLLADVPYGSPVHRHGRLKVVGNKIQNERNEDVQLRGMSFYWSNGPGGRDFYNADIVNWLASDWKVSLVRAAMGIEASWGEDQKGYLAGDNSGGISNKTRVLNVVDAAIAEGIYVIIDWHSHNAHTQTQQAIAFFEEMATKYKDVPNVIYEIYNEPQGGWCKPGEDCVAGRQTWQTIKPYHEAVVAAIRAIDPNGIIILGTPFFCQYVDAATENPVTGFDNLVYSLHFYPGSNEEHRQTLRDRATVALERGFALFVSEFGTTHESGNGDFNKDQTNLWFDFMKQHKISWANWSIAALGETSAALKQNASTNGGWTSNDLSESGAFIRSVLIAEHEADPWTPSKITHQRQSASAANSGWSVVRTGSGLQLKSPIGNSADNAKVSLYDIRGRFVMGASLKGGSTFTINKNVVPAGSYLLVVKNGLGKNVYKTRVSLVN